MQQQLSMRSCTTARALLEVDTLYCLLYLDLKKLCDMSLFR